jgi:hypothetical protein
MGSAPDESRLVAGNKEDKKMFEKEIDEIYELCKRVVNEVPTVSVEFSYSIYGIRVCGLKRKEDVNLPDGEFKWDLYQSVSFNPFYENASRESLRIIKDFLLELLIDGRCPLDVESNGTEAPADNGTDNDSK